MENFAAHPLVAYSNAKDRTCWVRFLEVVRVFIKKKKTFQNSIKKNVCRFQKCLANQTLKEASDGNSNVLQAV